MIRKIIRVLPASAAMLISFDAFAYIDPGTGSMMIQWVLGAALAGFAALNVYWVRVKAFFSGDSKREQPEAGAEDSQQEPSNNQ